MSADIHSVKRAQRCFETDHSFYCTHDPSGQQEGSRPLAGPDFLSMRRALVWFFQPIRFDNKSVNHGGGAGQVSILGTDQKDRGLWGRECR